MSVDETFPGRSFQQQQPRTATLFIATGFAVAITFLLIYAVTTPTEPSPTIPGVVDTCESSACLSPRQVVATSEAVQMKRRLGGHALLVDIRSPGERMTGSSVAGDVDAPFLESMGASGMQFHMDFGSRVDEALCAAHMGFDDPVIIMSPFVERAVLAALLLQERGYTNVLVMYDWSRAKGDRAASVNVA